MKAMVDVEIDTLRPQHWPAVQRIYAEGIAQSDARSETAVHSSDRWDGAQLGGSRVVTLMSAETACGRA